jgi:hypothetical protein
LVWSRTPERVTLKINRLVTKQINKWLAASYTQMYNHSHSFLASKDDYRIIEIEELAGAVAGRISFASAVTLR